MTASNSKPAQFKFFHGWGYRAGSWSGWEQALEGSGESLSLEFFDRGYFGAPHAVSPFEEDKGAKILVVHSLGLHFVPVEIMLGADWLVMISAFEHFHDFKDDRQASLTATRAMRSRLRRDAPGVLNDFYRQGSDRFSSGFENALDKERLREDLDLLDRAHFEFSPPFTRLNTLVLHGAKDLIVNSVHAEALKKSWPDGRAMLHPDANHSLPFTNVEWCVKQLTDCLAKEAALESNVVVGHAR